MSQSIGTMSAEGLMAPLARGTQAAWAWFSLAVCGGFWVDDGLLFLNPRATNCRGYWVGWTKYSCTANSQPFSSCHDVCHDLDLMPDSWLALEGPFSARTTAVDSVVPAHGVPAHPTHLIPWRMVHGQHQHAAHSLPAVYSTSFSDPVQTSSSREP